MRKKKFVLRTIKNGQVKIYGRVFVPHHKGWTLLEEESDS